MNVFHISGENISDFLSKFNKMEIDYKNFSFGIFKGFEGFSPIDLDWKECQFIIATDDFNNVIGVIKFKRYKLLNHEYLSEEDFNSYKNGIKNYKGIMFVDVREDYRRQGIAKQMIKLFCDITDKETSKTCVRLGKLTNLGRDAKLLEIFKEYLPDRDIRL